MNKLNKIQAAQLLDHQAALNTAKEAVEAAIDAYNGFLADARMFVEGLAEEMTEWQEGRTDAWQESEKGDAYQGWLDAWQGVELDDLGVPDMDHAEAIADLPVSL